MRLVTAAALASAYAVDTLGRRRAAARTLFDLVNGGVHFAAWLLCAIAVVLQYLCRDSEGVRTRLLALIVVAGKSARWAMPMPMP